jgi:hypothetical protein
MPVIIVRVKCVVRRVQIVMLGSRCTAIVLFIAFSFLSVCVAGFPGLAQDQTVLSVEIIRM